ncbi:Pentatricopeptide repeat-containing protein, chloroplastic [Sesamum alatum]|uniref:Pentatricopeptide repeat-containing protein, chloroplastic n=1 Tax=Sesamum alatum TaxID=300844 RepID=A0AAE1XUL5_9LAMI|nr:Pentatricopeptide repeat-containing protein, chloroplastic [Sesamum alatum]
MLPSRLTFLVKFSLAHCRTITALAVRQTPWPPSPPPAENASLSMMADKCRSMDQLKQIHAQMILTPRIHDTFAASRLLNFCALSTSGDLNYALKLLEHTPTSNLFMWNTVIRALASSSNPFEGLLLYAEMRRRGVVPGIHTFPFVLKACSNMKSVKCCEQVHAHVLKFGLGSDLHVVNGLVRGMLEKEKVMPNDITLLGVLSACCHAGLLDYGRNIFYSMKRVYGIEPKIKHYTCMVDLLGRGGQVLEAEELIKGMVWKADVVIWGALLSACKEYGYIEVAERVVKEIRDLDPHNHAVYVILSNMYAEAGRWEDVMERRKGMKERSLKKTAGWSLMGGDT